MVPSCGGSSAGAAAPGNWVRSLGFLALFTLFWASTKRLFSNATFKRSTASSSGRHSCTSRAMTEQSRPPEKSIASRTFLPEPGGSGMSLTLIRTLSSRTSFSFPTSRESAFRHLLGSIVWLSLGKGNS